MFWNSLFPGDCCDYKSRKISPYHRDCIVNKTAISARTNRSIGGRAPSDYLPRLLNLASYNPVRQKEILESHLIDFDFLGSDDFDTFLAARHEALLKLIETVTGKEIARTGQATESYDSGEDLE